MNVYRVTGPDGWKDTRTWERYVDARRRRHELGRERSVITPERRRTT